MYWYVKWYFDFFYLTASSNFAILNLPIRNTNDFCVRHLIFLYFRTTKLSSNLKKKSANVP